MARSNLPRLAEFRHSTIPLLANGGIPPRGHSESTPRCAGWGSDVSPYCSHQSMMFLVRTQFHHVPPFRCIRLRLSHLSDHQMRSRARRELKARCQCADTKLSTLLHSFRWVLGQNATPHSMSRELWPVVFRSYMDHFLTFSIMDSALFMYINLMISPTYSNTRNRFGYAKTAVGIPLAVEEAQISRVSCGLGERQTPRLPAPLRIRGIALILLLFVLYIVRRPVSLVVSLLYGAEFRAEIRLGPAHKHQVSDAWF